MTARRAIWIVIGVSTAARLALAASVGGMVDEAYYSLYARNLDWSYFDHPPMVGVVTAIGNWLAGWIDPLFGIRFGFIVMFAGSSWLLARITERFFGARSALFAVIVLNTTLYYGLIVGIVALPDGPLLFFWLLTIDRLAAAFEETGRTSTWLVVGLAWGASMLSKYHGVLLPVGVVMYLIVRPSALRVLRTPGPYLGTIVGLAVFSPVIFWNASHGWASFRFQGGRSAGFQGFQIKYLAEAIIAQPGYLFPWIWWGLLVVLYSLIRRGPRRWSQPEAFLTCQALPALALFMGVSTYGRIMTYWPLIGFISLMPMLGRTLSDLFETRPVLIRQSLGAVIAAPVLLSVLFVAHTNFGLLQNKQGRLMGLFSPEQDPTVDVIRWDQIGQELKRRGLCDDPKIFLFTDNWNTSAKLAFATHYEVPVACFHPDSRSFTFWSRPDDWVGRDGIFVRVDECLAYAEYYAPWFTRIEPIAAIPVTRAGVPLQTVLLYRCVGQTDPYPFGYTGPGKVPKPVRSLAAKKISGVVTPGNATISR